MAKIKEFRVKKGLTQAELAEIVGAYQSTVAMWETGQRIPRIASLKKLAALFGCSIDELLTDSEDDGKDG